MILIVDRLRAVDHMSVEDCFVQSPLFGEAANHIETLYAQLDGATREVDELREALELIAEGKPENPIGDPWAFYDDLVNVARAAIAKAEGRP